MLQLFTAIIIIIFLGIFLATAIEVARSFEDNFKD